VINDYDLLMIYYNMRMKILFYWIYYLE